MKPPESKEREARAVPVADPGASTALADGVTAWLSPGTGWGMSNAGLVCGRNTSLLVDTLWDLPRTAAMLEGFGRELEAAPIGQVVNTHADGDHWFGNQLTGAGQIIATEAAARRMMRHGPREMKMLGGASKVLRIMSGVPLIGRRSWRIAADYFDSMMAPFDFGNIRPTLATQTFRDTLRLDVGGREVQLIEVGPAHTSGDLIVFLPEERIVLAGDVVFSGVIPVLWDGSAKNWIQACERILKLGARTVVPGHGPLTDASGVDLVRQYWEFLRLAAQRQFDKARPAHEAALRIARSEEFQKQPFAAWDGQERIVINVNAIYRRLMKLPRRIGVVERLNVLRRTAVLRELLRGIESPRHRDRL
jgi:cyclase